MVDRRTIVIAGNWKMHKTNAEAVAFIRELKVIVDSFECNAYLAVPFTALAASSHAARESRIVIGAQNVSQHAEGAFTGEISCSMLREAGARFVILGHSERRRLFNESSEIVNQKLKLALAHKIQPIVCVGETSEEQEAGRTESVLEAQLTQSLAGITIEQTHHLMIAYEPVWAIGTGRTASPEVAGETHSFCRSILVDMWGKAAEHIVIQYGGSVKSENAAELLNQPDIDGLLVGGASLEVSSFAKILNAQIRSTKV